MKAVYAIIVIMFLSVCSIFAQFELKSVAASIGKGALSSGYDINLGFSNGTNNLNIVGNHQRVYGTFSIPTGASWLSASVSGGFFKNCPWVGPMIVVKPLSFVSTVHWYGVSAGHPDQPSFDANLLIIYNAVVLRVGSFSATYAVCKFDNGHADQLPELRYDGDLNPSWNYSLSVGYTVDGSQPLFVFGLKHIF